MKKIIYWVGTPLLVVFALLLLLPQSNPQGDTLPEPAAPQAASVDGEAAAVTPENIVVQNPVTLGIAPAEYTARLQSGLRAASVDLPAELGATAIGPVNDTATVNIGEHCAVVLSIDKATGHVASVFAIVQGDGTAESGRTAALVGIAALGAAAKPALASETTQAALDLLSNRKTGRAETVVGDMEITYGLNEMLGATFTAGPIAAAGAT